jgi:antitoxin YefM
MGTLRTRRVMEGRRATKVLDGLDGVGGSLYVVPVQEASVRSETTYTHARANLAALCDAVSSSRDAVVIHRRGAEDVALVSAAELRSLMETAHLLRSPRNAARLLTALARAQSRKRRPSSVTKLRKELGLDVG